MTAASRDHERAHLVALRLSPVLAGHLATAVRSHRQWAAGVSLPVPPELADIERLLVDAATSRHEPSGIDDLFRLRDRPIVAPRLLNYGAAAEALSVSLRTGLDPRSWTR